MIKRYLLLLFITVLFTTGAYAQTTITGASGNYPTAASLDADANIYIVQYDSGNNEYDVVKYTAASGYSTSLVIYNGVYFNGEYPTDIEVAFNGDVYVLDGFDEPASTGAILRLDASNGYSSSTVPLLGSYPVALGIDGNDDIYVSEYDGGTDDYQVVKYDVSAGYASTVLYNGLGLDTYPRGLTGDRDGNVYVLTSFGKDVANGKILKLTAPGYGPTTLDQGEYYTGLAVNGNGDLFATAYNSGADNFSIVKYTGGSGAPTSVVTGLTYSGSSYPTGLGSNLALGDIVIPDPWNASNGTVTYMDLTDPATTQAPTVTTSSVSSITATGATLSGNVTDDGGDTVTERGFVYGMNTPPTIGDGRSTRLQDGSGTGAFEEDITGLTTETTYYVRAYAINGEGTSYGSEESFTTSAPTLDPVQSLYWPNYGDDKIEGITVTGANRQDVVTVPASATLIAIDIDYVNEKVYWFDQNDSKIYRANLDGTGSEEFISDPGYASTIFVDPVNEYLYWPNNGGSKIERIKLDGTGREDVISATDPIAMSVDLGNSKVYWFDQTNSKIFRGNLDGTGSEEFISDPGYASTFYIDQVNDYLYWPDGSTKIERIQLDGTGREDVTSATNPIAISVDVDNSKVYWYDSNNDNISRANLDGTGSEVFVSNSGYATTMSIPQEIPSNSSPTDIALTSTTVNKSEGANAIVGTLSTTDSDVGDTHTYSLVAGTGDTNNSNFNINGSDLRATDASALAAGEYSVRIQTNDGTATYQESFTITLNDDVAPNFTNTTPSVSGTTGSQTTLTVQLNETGTAYYVVVADGDGAPSSAGVKAGQNSSGGAALFSGSITVSSASQDFTEEITGLSQSTSYDVYVVAEDGEGNLQNNPELLNIETLGPPEFTTTPVTEVDYGQLYSYSMTATEVGDLSTTTSAPTLPQWLTLNTDGQSEAGQIGNIPDGALIIGVAGDADGNVYAADPYGIVIYKIESDGTTTQWASGLDRGNVYALHVAGNYLYIPRIGDETHSVTRIALDNPGAGEEVFYAKKDGILSLSDRGDWIYAANYYGTEIVRIHKTSKTVETVLTEKDGLLSPFGLEFDEEGNLFIATYGNRSILKFDGSLVTNALSSLPKNVTSVKIDESENFYISMGNGGIRKYDFEWNNYSYVSPGETDNIWSISFTNTGALVYGINGTNEVYRLQTGAVLSGTPAKSDLGTHPVVLEASNSEGSTQQSFSIDVQDNVGPVVQTFSPTNQSTDIDLQPTLAITFDEEIELGTEGKLSLYDGATKLQSYDLSVPAEQDNFSLSADHKTLSLNVDADLPLNTEISVEITNGGADNFANDVHGNAFAGFTADSGTWTFTTIANTAPVAGNVSFSGSLNAGEELTASYDYTDVDGDTESGTTYQWYRSDDDQGTGKGAITGAASVSYTTTGDDFGKYISFEVTPNDGLEFGSAVESPLLGPVFTEPELVTSAATGVEALEATLNAEVTTDNFDSVSDRGFVYSLTATPTLAIDSVLTAGNGVGTYSALAQNLLPNRTYFVRSYAINSAGTVYGNEVSFTTGKRELTLAGSFTALDKEYDGTTTVTTSENSLEVIGLEGTDQANLASVELFFAQADTGTAITVTVSNPVIEGPDAGNYTVTAVGAPTSSASILPKELTISGTFSIVEKRYDGTTGAVMGVNSLSLIGIVGTEIVILDGIELNFPQSDAGTGLVVSLSNPVIGGADASNYTITADGAPTIATDLLPYVLTLSDFTADDKVYDGTSAVTGTGFSDDRFDGDLIEFSYDAEYENIQAGTGINVNYSNIALSGGTDQNNYILTSSSGTTIADIAQRPISLAANATSKVYGDGDPLFTYELTSGSVVGGDSFSGFLNRTGDELVGIHTISQGSLTAGDNYSVTFTSADFKITQKALTIVANSDQTKVYGETDPALSFSASGFEFTEDETILTGALDRASGEDAGSYTIAVGDLDAGINYSINFTPADFEITPRPLTLTNFVANDKTYDGSTDVTGTGLDDDRLNDDDVTYSYDVAFASADAATSKNVNFSTITISGGADELNYDLQTTSGIAAADIGQRPVTITADAQQVVYGEADPVLTYQISTGSLVTGEQLTGDLSRVSGQDVGVYAIQQGTLTAGSNYDITYQSADFEITPRTLAITAHADQTKTYGEADPTFTFEATNFGLSDDKTLLTGSLDRVTGEGVGQYAIGQGNLDAGSNYTINFTSSTFEITQKSLAIVASSDQTKIYGEADPALTFTTSGFEAGDGESLLTGALDRASGEDAGSYAIAVGDLDAGNNYSISYTSADFEITPRPLTLADFAAESKVYDGTADVDGTGFTDDRLPGDDLTFSYDVALQDVNAGDQRDVSYSNIAITEGIDTGNYTLATTTGVTKTQIAPRPITVTAQPVEVVYGEADPALTYEITDGSLVSGDSFSGDLSRTGDQNVGSYTIEQNTLSAGANYEITYQAAAFEIAKRTLSIAANSDQAKTYGEADPALTFEATNFGWNDDVSILSGSLVRGAGEDVGHYAIGQANLDAGDNYTINYTPANFEITRKTMTIVANSDQTKVYGENDPTLTFMANGFEFTDDEQILTGTLDRAMGEDAGSYAIGAGDIDAGTNYSISFTPADYEIERRPLFLSSFVADSKTYDGTDNVTGDGFADDRLSGDDLTFTYTATFSGADAGTDKDVNFSGIQVYGGNDQANYDLKTTFGIAKADIARRQISVAAKPVEIIYGEPDPALDYQITSGSLMTGETITGDLSRTGDQNVGSYTIEKNTLTAGANYEITYQSADFVIAKRTLAIAVDADQAKTYGEVDPSFTFQSTNFGWNDDTSILMGELIRTAGEDVGQYEIGLGNLNAGNNYTINYNAADFEITAKELMVVVDADQQKTYGDDDPNTFSFASSNFADGDDTSMLSGSLKRDAGENAGMYTITAGDLSAGPNYQVSFTQADFEILPAVLTITASEEQTKIYGDDDPDFIWTAEGFQFSDDEQIVSGQIDRDPGENSGSYELTAGSLAAGDNYTISYSPTDFAIMPALLRVIADDEQWKFEGSEDPVLIYTAEGFVFDDGEALFNGVLGRNAGETPGDYAIQAGNLSAGGNYEIDFTGADFSILRTPPIVVQRSPGEDDGRVALDAVITAKFDHEITVADGTLVTLSGPDATAIPITLSADGSVLTVTHGDLSHHTEYTLVIDGGALVNVDGIGNEAATWSFTTIMSAPVAENPSPVDGATHVGVNNPLSVAFSQDVTLADASAISIVSGQGGSPADIQAELLDNVLVISHGGLDHLTAYTISVPQGTVQNADDVGNEPVSWSFTSIVPVPDPVALTAPVDQQGTVDLNSEFEWDSTPHAKHYRIQVSETEKFEAPVTDVDQLTELNFAPAESLSDYQTYFWRVKAANDAGESEWSDVNRFTTIANTPAAIFPMMDSENISIAPMQEWNSEYGTTYRVQLGKTFGFETPVADSLTTNQAVQITGLEDDSEYFWRVRVETDSTESSWTDAIRFRTRPAASTEDDVQVVDHSVTFGETSNQEERVISELDYRMVGLPGNNHHGVEDFFVGKYGREWKVFYENGNDTEYYDEYEQGDDRFFFAPGRGFWVLSTDIMNLDLKVTSVTTNEHDAYSVSLHPGWNIITNPHRGPVSWSDVQEMNSFIGDAWGYDQRFVLADTLHPVQGYYVFNHPDKLREHLDIPYATMEQRRSEERGKALITAKSTTSLPAVNLSAQFEENGRFDTQILYPDLTGTQNDGNELDEESLRRYYPSLEMSRSGMMLVNDEHIARGGLLREVSRFDADGTELELHIKGEIGEQFSWMLNLEQMPEQTRALVVNRANSKTWLLKHGEEVETTLTEPNAVYDLYTGDRDRLEQLQIDLMPQEFALEPNYPNPFNPITNIRYSIPSQQHVKLEVYDVIGRRVKVLTNNVQQAGWHVAQFDAGSLASGIYLYRLTTDNNVKVRKMTLVK